ncbi:11730_t:CDS:2, partial [Gigaspora rosea]
GSLSILLEVVNDSVWMIGAFFKFLVIFWWICRSLDLIELVENLLLITSIWPTTKIVESFS